MEFETLKKIIAEVLGVDPNEITLDTTFTDDLGADSLDLYQIILEVQEELNIEVDEEVASGIKTVGDAVELLEKSVSDK
ncbi:MAG TPA: acyl carrier protein [Lachnospiraceae bacterium]|jgi:acyl carrier protein|nr:acyl carrier protein [Lachnospiraceae bacterium]MDD6149000.1 acyl carrier protein [Lachnospiraceae bacterium]MDY5705000.1 acyl carrier protein [Lachnospiraceae bacterium]MEE3356460.1 acyl carrier protein [Lachnospiraceae bacterium]HAN50987.1 acyl carrier protein [Lachnospiraceae bacterium]